MVGVYPFSPIAEVPQDDFAHNEGLPASTPNSSLPSDLHESLVSCRVSKRMKVELIGPLPPQDPQAFRMEVLVLFQALFWRLFPRVPANDSPLHLAKALMLSDDEERDLLEGLERVNHALVPLPAQDKAARPRIAGPRPAVPLSSFNFNPASNSKLWFRSFEEFTMCLRN